MSQEEWSQLVEDINKLIEADPDRHEAETKSKIVEPLLRHLGWSFRKDEVKVEYPIEFATSTSHVDYALMIGESPAVFVEVKPLRANITTKDAQQTVDYGRINEVTWCVLTNGKEVRIYNTNWYKDKTDVEEALLEQIKLSEFCENKAALDRISKHSIEKGEIDRYAKARRQAIDSVAAIQSNEAGIKAQIGCTLKKYSGELLHEKIENLVNKFVDNVTEKLKDLSQQVDLKEKEAMRKDTTPKIEAPDEIIKKEEERNRVRINPENLKYQGQEDLTHAKIENANATFGEVTGIENWKNLVEEAIKQAISAGKKDVVRDIISSAQVGVTGDNPNRYVVEGTDISLIPMDSNHCCSYASKLARELNRKLRIEFYWRNKKEALHPGEKGIIEWLPEGRK